MNSFDDLSRRVDRMTAPTLDVEGLIARGERRLHRRRVTAVLAAVVVVALLAVGGLVASATQHRSTGPVDNPDKHHQPSASPTREIVYSNYADRFAHFGDRRAPIGQSGVLHLDVTDDGFVYTAPDRNPYAHPPRHDPRVWFSDGGTPQQIGTLCRPSLSRLPDEVITANAGSLAAWVDCPDSGAPAIVVLDTSTGREILREPTARFVARAGSCCALNALIGDQLYFDRGGPGIFQALRLDLSTRQVSKYVPIGGTLLPAAYLDDIRSNPRGLVVGDTWSSGTPTDGITDGIGQAFWVDGTRLVPVLDANEPSATTAFDTTTHRPIRLHLPPGYHAHHDALGRGDFWLFEWLNDDTVALAGPTSEILTCQLSNGHCQLAVAGGTARSFAHLQPPA